MPTLAQLRTPVTEDQALTTILGYLKDVGFNSTSWQVGSLQRLFVRMFAIVYSDLTSLVAAIANFAYNETSSGDALDAFSASHYDNIRNAATYTAGVFRFSNNGIVPYTVNPSDLVIAFTEPDGTQRTYRNTTGLALGVGIIGVMSMTAETPGAAWNIPNYSTLAFLTPLAGVAVTNPPASGLDTWITSLGTDKESDPTLKTRNRTKWATLSLKAIRDTTINVALSASPSITRALPDDNNPRGAGTVDVYIAGANDTSGVDDVAAAQAALAARFFGSDTVRTYAAPTVPVDITGIIYYDSNFDATAVQAAIEASIVAFLASVPLGGFDYTPGPSHAIPKNDLENAIKDTEINGQRIVKTLTLSVPVADLSLTSFGVAIRGTWSITYTSVAG